LGISHALYSHAGGYSVEISDECAPITTVTSASALLQVTPDPKWHLRTTNGPSRRAASQMVFDSSRGVTLLFGGYGWDETIQGNAALNDLWEWNGGGWRRRVAHSGNSGWTYQNRWVWTNSAQPPPREVCAAAYDSTRGRLVIFGGHTWLPGSGGDVLLHDT